MLCDVKMKEKDFTDLHNAICELETLNNPAVDEIVKRIRASLNDCYDQENEVFDRKHSLYSETKRKFCLKSVWSIYEVDDFCDDQPYENIKKMMYAPYGGPVVINNCYSCRNWLDLYLIANMCIEESGDSHHIYIEGFEVSKTDPTMLVLTTGS